MSRGFLTGRSLPWGAVPVIIAATAGAAALQAYLLQSGLTLLSLLVAAAFVYAESRRESPVSRWLRHHYLAVSGALVGAVAGASFIAPFLNPGMPLTPLIFVVPGIFAAFWLFVALGILYRPGRAGGDAR